MFSELVRARNRLARTCSDHRATRLDSNFSKQFCLREQAVLQTACKLYFRYQLVTIKHVVAKKFKQVHEARLCNVSSMACAAGSVNDAHMIGRTDCLLMMPALDVHLCLRVRHAGLVTWSGRTALVT